MSKREKRTFSHVVSLEHLPLVTSSISVHGESSMFVILTEVLLCESDTSSQRNLRSNDTVSTEETEKSKTFRQLFSFVSSRTFEKKDKKKTYVGVKMCIDPPFPFDIPSTRPNNSAKTPLIVPPLKTAKG